MRRGLLGICVLLALLLGGIFVSCKMRNTHLEISQLLQQAQASANAGDWQKASVLAEQAKMRWQKHHHFTASFADHNPMDELDGLFSELMVYLENQESPHFEATCARLSFLAQAMADSHSPQWWNIL